MGYKRIRIAVFVVLLAYMNNIPFSAELEQWLKSPGKKTIMSLNEVFAEKSFALAFLLLLSLSALPLPTGGITQIFEAIAMLLALELIIGRTTIWLPKRWQKFHLGSVAQKKAIPFIARRVRWFEKFSRPRLSGIMIDHNFMRLIGLTVFTFILAAFIAPPFSGLDTLPSLAVVIISISLVLEDIVLLGVGIVIGLAGIALEIIFSGLIIAGLQQLF